MVYDNVTFYIAHTVGANLTCTRIWYVTEYMPTAKIYIYFCLPGRGAIWAHYYVLYQRSIEAAPAILELETNRPGARSRHLHTAAVHAAEVVKTGCDHGKAMEKPRSRPRASSRMSVALPLASFLDSIDHTCHLLFFLSFLARCCLVFFPSAPRRLNPCIVFDLCRAPASKLPPLEHTTHVPRSSVRVDVFPDCCPEDAVLS